MSNPFFDHPILNSTYEITLQPWKPLVGMQPDDATELRA
jgi:hypothetical protein